MNSGDKVVVENKNFNAFKTKSINDIIEWY